MTQPAVPIDVLLPRMRERYQDIAGPGMRGDITGGELRGLLERIDELEARVPVEAPAGRRSRAKRERDGSRARALAEVLQVASDILESHSELWNTPLMDAVPAWCAQRSIEMPSEWTAAIEAALSGAVE